MFKLCKAGLFVFALLASAFAAAQGKIAVLDVQAAILNTDAAQKQLKDLRAQGAYTQNRKELDKLKTEYESIIKQLQKDLAVMSNDQKEAQRKKIEEKRADLDHVARKLQASEQELAQRLIQELAPKLEKIVTDLIKAEGIGLLLDRKAAMHADPAFNITDKVTAALNKG